MEALNEAKLFNDNSDISAYAADSIELMQRAGIIDDTENGYLMSANNSTRAETAKIVYLLLRQLKQ